jgi:hypothetical protein
MDIKNAKNGAKRGRYGENKIGRTYTRLSIDFRGQQRRYARHIK